MTIYPNDEDQDSIEQKPAAFEKDRGPVKKSRSDAGQPALTIQIQSWATPVIGVVMLLLGLAGGYFLRPFLAERSPGSAVAVNPTGTTTTAAPPAVAGSPQPTTDLMEFLVGETHHFIGDEAAPVTMIEFSDFQ